MAYKSWYFGYGVTPADQEVTYPKHYLCDAQADLPTSGLIIGSRAYCIAEKTRWIATSATVWEQETGGAGGGLGYVLNGSAANQATTTDSQTLYWGSLQLAPQTVANNCRIYVPRAGTLTVAQVFTFSGTAGSAEDWSMYLRKNNTTDTLIQTLALGTAQRLWSNYLLSVAVSAGDYFEVKEIEPAWATNPANVRRAVTLYVE